jgi:hypothetical protein
VAVELLALPGRKESTLRPMQGLIARLSLGQALATVQTYGFWGGEDVADPDIAPEIRRAAASGAGLIVAKSIGTLIAMEAARAGLSPKACLFMGVPLRRLEALGLVGLLESHLRRIPTLIIQQTGDFNGPFVDLAPLALQAGAEIREIPGDDHLYEDLDLIAPLVDQWLAAAVA